MKKIIVLFLISSLYLLVGCGEKTVSMGEKINKEFISHPTSSGGGSVFYVDPLYGNMNNPGTKEYPWSTFEEVVNSKSIETKNSAGEVINEGAPVKSGDTIVLMTGYHGDISIKHAYNDEAIIVRAEPDNRPVISSLKLSHGNKWIFDGLTVDGSLTSILSSTHSYMVEIGSSKGGYTYNIRINNFYIFSAQDVESWSSDEWNEYTFNGIKAGLLGSKIFLENNFIENVGLAINVSSEDSIVSGNKISYMTRDGIHISNNNILISDNIITDNLKVNTNHDDAIQGYKGDDGLHDVFMINNIVIENHDPSNRYPGSLQAIGFFAGPNTGIVATDNVLKVSGFHGISIYDSERAKILSNVLTGFNGKKNRIFLGTKNRGLISGNIVISNVAEYFDLSLDNKVVNNNNKVVESENETYFLEKLNKVLNKINYKYGEFHVTSGKYRLLF